MERVELKKPGTFRAREDKKNNEEYKVLIVLDPRKNTAT